MRRQDATWWLASAGIHVVIALVATLLFYETRSPIGRPSMTVLCIPERPRDVVDYWRHSPSSSGGEEPRIIEPGDREGELEDAPTGELWMRWDLVEDGEPSVDWEQGGGGRWEVRSFS